jgi:hypothetical protein
MKERYLNILEEHGKALEIGLYKSHGWLSRDGYAYIVKTVSNTAKATLTPRIGTNTG